MNHVKLKKVTIYGLGQTIAINLSRIIRGKLAKNPAMMMDKVENIQEFLTHVDKLQHLCDSAIKAEIKALDRSLKMLLQQADKKVKILLTNDADIVNRTLNLFHYGLNDLLQFCSKASINHKIRQEFDEIYKIKAEDSGEVDWELMYANWIQK